MNYILINMKFKIFVVGLLLLASIGFVCAETYMPHEGPFAYKEVQKYSLNGFDFVMPTIYNLTYHDNTDMHFEGNNETFNVNVVKDANQSGNSTAFKGVSGSKTMVGSVEGDLVEKNGTYEFSFHQQDYTVTLTSKDMSLMIGVMGRD